MLGALFSVCLQGKKHLIQVVACMDLPDCVVAAGLAPLDFVAVPRVVLIESVVVPRVVLPESVVVPRVVLIESVVIHVRLLESAILNGRPCPADSIRRKKFPWF